MLGKGHGRAATGDRTRRRTLLRLIFTGLLLLSAVLLFTPARDVPSGPPGTDKVVHLALFGALAVSGLAAGVPGRALVPALLVYAGISEPLQGLPAIGRSTSLADFAADAAGVLAGYAGFVARTRSRSTAGS
jgi:hypothetical protein